MPRVRHLSGGALFPGWLFLVAGHLSCDASSIGGSEQDFRKLCGGQPGRRERVGTLFGHPRGPQPAKVYPKKAMKDDQPQMDAD
jgi:hypothetical protein